MFALDMLVQGDDGGFHLWQMFALGGPLDDIKNAH
jgi:hypothetical protein